VFPDEPVLFEGRGKVVRHGENPQGMGVEFIELDDAARTLLREIQLKHEAERRLPTMAQRQVELRVHGLVTRVVDED
jgi:hypothetical protein